MDAIHKISKYILYALLAISLVIFGLFFFGGTLKPTSDTVEPVNTNSLMFWAYSLLALSVLVTLFSIASQSFIRFQSSPWLVIKSLIGLFLLILLLFVSWLFSSEEILVLQFYDGNENVPFWLKLTDMLLYTIYFLMGAAILLIISFGVAKKFK